MILAETKLTISFPDDLLGDLHYFATLTTFKMTGALGKPTFNNFQFTDETLTRLKPLPASLPVQDFIFMRQ